jgi:hypothetical protein
MRFEIGFGVGFTRDGTPIDSLQVAEATKVILVEACRRFGGCNITSGQGAWMDGDNLVVEESRTLVVDTHSGPGSRQGFEDEKSAYELAQFIGRLLNQKAVHVTEAIGLRSYDQGVRV